MNETHCEASPKTGGPIKLNEILHEVAKHIEDRFKTGNVITGISTGFIDLDYMTCGLQPGELIIVAGRPGMGTTSLATSLLESTLLQTDKAILVFSLDISAASLGMRMLSSIGRIEIAKIREGRLEADDWPRLTSAINVLNDRKLFIDETPGISPEEMSVRTRHLVHEHGEPALIVVDKLQLMQLDGRGGKSRSRITSEISRSLKGLAKEFNCPVVVLSQLNSTLEKRANKRPTISDLGSACAIEQDADVIMFVYRDEVYNPDTENKGVARIIIGKQRNGPNGRVWLAFQGKYTRFDNLAPGSYQFDDD